MTYNWNGELNGQRKSQLLMQTSLILSVVTFVAVILVMAYFIADLRLIEPASSFSTATWTLRG